MLQIEEQVREGKKDKNLKIRTVSRNSVELYDGEQLLDTLTKDKYGIWSSDTDPMRYGYRRGKYHAFCKSRYCRATDGYSFIMNENQCRVQ